MITPTTSTNRLRKVNNRENKKIKKAIRWDSTFQTGREVIVKK